LGSGRGIGFGIALISKNDGDVPEQLISNGGRFQPTFAERDKKQTMRNLDKLV
jgi:hypothetical protein